MQVSDQIIQQAVATLKAGGCIAYPTEAVWGLGCDPSNTDAVEMILKLKRRPVEKGLILISGSIAHFEHLLDGMDSDTVDTIRSSWPGHTTWLVPHQNLVSPMISGTSEKVAIRVSQHPVVSAITEAFDGPIVSTSANPAGEASARTRDSVQRYFGDTASFREGKLQLIPGEVGGQANASKIIDALSGQVLRA